MKWDQFWITIISSKRPGNVQAMQQFAPLATWYVGNTFEALAYMDHGAKELVIGGDLISSRNQALEDAFRQGLWCVQLSDDLRKMNIATSSKTKQPISLDDALDMIREAMLVADAYLGGVAPTDNPFYANVNRPISTTSFIVGDFIVVRPTFLRFDPALSLKEDYDYTAQHIKQYGKVARCNLLLASFTHDTNAGGAVSYRTDLLEQKTIEYLKHKHGRWIMDNPKRKNQILLKVR